MLNRGTCAIRLNKAHHALETLAGEPRVGRYFGVEDAASPLLKQGWALYDAAHHAHHARRRRHAAALEAGRQCASIFEAARIRQARLSLLARVVITVPSDRDRLGLNGRRPEGLAAWRMQAALFHANLRPCDRELLAEVGVDETLLARAHDLISQLEAAHAARVAAEAEARRATEVKTAAFEALAAFMTRLNTMARGLEREVPHLVLLLGMGRDSRLNRGRAGKPSTPDDLTQTQTSDAVARDILPDLEPPTTTPAASPEDEASTAVAAASDEMLEPHTDTNSAQRQDQDREPQPSAPIDGMSPAPQKKPAPVTNEATDQESGCPMPPLSSHAAPLHRTPRHFGG